MARRWLIGVEPSCIGLIRGIHVVEDPKTVLDQHAAPETAISQETRVDGS